MGAHFGLCIDEADIGTANMRGLLIAMISGEERA